MKKKWMILLICATVVCGVFIGIKIAAGLTGDGGSSAGNDEIRKGVEKIVSEESYVTAETETRGQMIQDYLEEAADNGATDSDGSTIVKESIERDTENELCLYVDTDGGLNVVQYGRDESYALEDDFLSGGYEGDVEDTKGILLFGLDGPDSASARLQEQVVQQLNAMGSECDIDTFVTVSEYKTKLSGNDYVLIRTHGSMLRYGYGLKNESSDKVPVLCTKEEITSENRKEYEDDIREQRIAKVTVVTDPQSGATAQYYWIMPSFFTEYYGGSGLDGAYVHLGCCCGFGSSQTGGGSVDYTLAEAFIDCGAESVTGFYNTVFTGYGTDMIASIMSSMLAGATLQEAADTAMEKYGYDDGEYASLKGWLDTGSPYYKSTREKLDKGAARLIIYGDPDKSFADDEDEYINTGTYDVVGTWLDLEGRATTDPELQWGDHYLKFYEDWTGELAFAGGVETFTYTIDDSGTITIRIDDAYGSIHKAVVNDDWTVITLYDDEDPNISYEFTYWDYGY